MRPVRRADLAAVDDAKERRANGMTRGSYWVRRNPFGRSAVRGRHHDDVSGCLARVVALRAGRNDPCPCGSGAKYKRCCRP